MKSLKDRIAEKFNDKNFEKQFLQSSAFYRLASEVLLLRKQRGLTQKELAEKIGTTQAVISRVESASVKPSFDTILKIADALDAAMDVRLLPVENIRRKSAQSDNEDRQQNALKGILYYDQEQSALSSNAKWISSENTNMPQIEVKPVSLKPAHKVRHHEYA